MKEGDSQLTFQQRRKRFIIHFLYPFVRLYWRIFTPKTFGAKAIIECAGKFLIIRNTYGSGRPTFPGGGIENGESAYETVKREVEEEVGLSIDPTHIGDILSTTEGKRDHVAVFSATVESEELIVDWFEIKEAVWLKPEDFPTLSPVGQKLWTIYKKETQYGIH